MPGDALCAVAVKVPVAKVPREESAVSVELLPGVARIGRASRHEVAAARARDPRVDKEHYAAVVPPCGAARLPVDRASRGDLGRSRVGHLLKR